MKGIGCNRCGELIVLCVSIRGEPIAINAGAVANGTIGLEHQLRRVEPVAHLAPNIPADKCSAIRFVPHLSTCKNRTERSP